MTEKDFRRIVLALDGVVERAYKGHPDFRAHGRLFATVRHVSSAELTGWGPPLFGVLMLTPQQQHHFVATSRGFAPESGAWGRAGCTRVCLEEVDEETLGEAVTLAWQNAAAKPRERRERSGSRGGVDE